MDFLWVYILGSLAIVAVIIFLITFSPDVKLVKKLKLKKTTLWLNFSLLVISGISISLVIFLFILLRNQINLLG